MSEKEIIDYLSTLLHEIMTQNQKQKQFIEKTFKDIIIQLKTIILPTIAFKDDDGKKNKKNAQSE